MSVRFKIKYWVIRYLSLPALHLKASFLRIGKI